jgi:MFS family permease
VLNIFSGLHGIFIGVGQILGGAIFGIFGSWTNRIGRWPIVTLGTVVSFTAFILILLNVPYDSPVVTETIEETFISPPSEYLAIACSALLGFGDACANTQVISLLGSVSLICQSASNT